MASSVLSDIQCSEVCRNRYLQSMLAAMNRQLCQRGRLLSDRLIKVTLGVAVLGCALTHLAAGQQTSVKPGINEPFETPDVDTFIDRFERDGREIFDKREQIVQSCFLKAGMDVADIGAGTGLFTRMFAKAVGKKGTVWAVDISDEFLEHIKKSAREEGLSNIRRIVCDQDDTKLPPNSVDLVFMCDTYHHLEFPARIMASVYRALRRGGQLIVIDFHRKAGETDAWLLDHIRADRETVMREIQGFGFGVVGEASFLEKNYFLRFLKVEPETSSRR